MDVLMQILINIMMSFMAFYITLKIIPKVKPLFIKANLFGFDLCKSEPKTKIAESQGVITGCIYLVVMFLFIPIPFTPFKANPFANEWLFTLEDFRHEVFAQFISALLSICCMIFLGFADDVLDLRWRTKLLLPTIATIPLLMVYLVTYNNTTIIVPKPFRDVLGYSLYLGPIYYIYLGMLAVFCTNSINIVAGINGIEAGQGLVIGLSIITYNIIEFSSDQWQYHLFSLHFMLPFIGVTIGLLYHNWYPSQVFVGDTYCYFAGMTFAVVGILGHFSKTMLLFFMPQVFNFLYSCPQLFHFVECPRHRLPKYDAKEDKVFASTFQLKLTQTKTLGALFIYILRTLGLVKYQKVAQSLDTFECSNLTIINLILVKLGPMKENKVTILLLVIQVLCSFIALFIRYGVSKLFY